MPLPSPSPPRRQRTETDAFELRSPPSVVAEASDGVDAVDITLGMLYVSVHERGVRALREDADIAARDLALFRLQTHHDIEGNLCGDDFFDALLTEAKELAAATGASLDELCKVYQLFPASLVYRGAESSSAAAPAVAASPAQRLRLLHLRRRWIANPSFTNIVRTDRNRLLLEEVVGVAGPELMATVPLRFAGGSLTQAQILAVLLRGAARTPQCMSVCFNAQSPTVQDVIDRRVEGVVYGRGRAGLAGLLALPTEVTATIPGGCLPRLVVNDLPFGRRVVAAAAVLRTLLDKALYEKSVHSALRSEGFANGIVIHREVEPTVLVVCPLFAARRWERIFHDLIASNYDAGDFDPNEIVHVCTASKLCSLLADQAVTPEYQYGTVHRPRVWVVASSAYLTRMEVPTHFRCWKVVTDGLPLCLTSQLVLPSLSLYYEIIVRSHIELRHVVEYDMRERHGSNPFAPFLQLPQHGSVVHGVRRVLPGGSCRVRRLELCAATTSESVGRQLLEEAILLTPQLSTYRLVAVVPTETELDCLVGSFRSVRRLSQILRVVVLSAARRKCPIPALADGPGEAQARRLRKDFSDMVLRIVDKSSLFRRLECSASTFASRAELVHVLRRMIVEVEHVIMHGDAQDQLSVNSRRRVLNLPRSSSRRATHVSSYCDDAAAATEGAGDADDDDLFLSIRLKHCLGGSTFYERWKNLTGETSIESDRVGNQFWQPRSCEVACLRGMCVSDNAHVLKALLLPFVRVLINQLLDLGEFEEREESEIQTWLATPEGRAVAGDAVLARSGVEDPVPLHSSRRPAAAPLGPPSLPPPARSGDVDADDGGES